VRGVDQAAGDGVSTSQIFGAVKALVSISKTALPATVDVFLGPITVQVPEQDFLLVMCDDPHNQGAPIVGVDGTSDWAALGAGRRDETFVIHNTYVAFSSNPDISALLDRAATNIGLIETAMRGTAGFILGGALNSPAWAAVQIIRVSAVNVGDGVQLHVLFGVACRGRI
jgi:hypothetical protein